MNEQLLYEIVGQMTSYAGLNEEFADQFYDKLCENRDIHDEFCTYVDTGYLEGRVKVDGTSVMDILVWQVNQLKARFDLDKKGARENPQQMVLLAFDTLMNMRKEESIHDKKYCF